MNKQNNLNPSVAIFANGCFWCTEAVFQRLTGVDHVISGYTGGTIKNPSYREVCTGRTGHAEALKITFQSNIISYSDLLEVFFATHDPTTLNRQGNDVGTQYRSEIFYVDDDQKQQAMAYIELLETEKVFKNPIVTAISPEKPFYEAEMEHHDYYNQNSSQPYCQFAINPKIEKLKQKFADRIKSNYAR